MRVQFLYTNWRGEVGVRVVIPSRFYWGKTEHHPEPQWLLEAWDCNKGQPRTFAMKDVKDWQPVQEFVEAV